MHVFITLLLAMAPISELRGAIPYALANNMSYLHAYCLAVIGNLLPVIPLLLLLGPISTKLRRFKVFDKFFSWWFSHTLKKAGIIERYGVIGLVIFVAIPLPITGAWTGSVASFLMGLKFKFAFISILIGVLVAGVVVSLVCFGIFQIPVFVRHF